MVRIIIGLLLIAALNARADESFASLKVRAEVYTNVTVMSVTATDIYFTHARGMASAKLKDLDPELQKHFHFDTAKSAAAEKAQAKATADFRAKLAEQKPAAKTPQSQAQDNDEDFVVPALHAKSVRGQAAPTFVVEKWISEQPDTSGKFVLVDFWATWCG